MRLDEIKTDLKNTLTAQHYRTIMKLLKTDYSLDKRAARIKNKVIKLWKTGNKMATSYDAHLKPLGISLSDIIKKK